VRRFFLVLLLVANLVLGVARWVQAPRLNGEDLWDLRCLVTETDRCRVTPQSTEDLAAACPNLPPFLPLAFPLARSLARVPWPVIDIAWYAGVGLLLLLAFSREATLWARDRRVTPAGSELHGFALVAASLVMFKGTSLGYFAGQPSVACGLLLYAFAAMDPDLALSDPAAPEPSERRIAEYAVAVLCLALGAIKPNAAPAFFVFLLLRRRWAMLATACAMVVALNLPASLEWPGPASAVGLLLRAPAQIGSWENNLASHLGGSGRVDLEPLLATLGLTPLAGEIALLAIAAGGLVFLWRAAGRVSARRLLVATTALFLALIYHRDYDVILLLLLVLPLLREDERRGGWIPLLIAVPLVLPLQALHELGSRALPSLDAVWNLVGCSTPLALVALTVWVLGKEPPAVASKPPAAH
jgi:hypothetical protein